MSDKPLSFGVIGCGYMAAEAHCPNVVALDGAQTTAYCDIDESKAAALLEKFGGDYATTDVDRIFADDALDGVLIQVHESVHPGLVQKAAKAGKHIFVEKPIAQSVADAVACIRAVEEAGVKFIYGTCNRLGPNVQMAKKMCPDPVYTFCQCTDTVAGQASHNIDLAVNLFHNAPVQRVYASGGHFYDQDPHIPADSYSAVVTFADGTTFTYIQHAKAYNPMLGKYHFQLFGRDRCVYLAQRFKEAHLMTSRDKVDQSWIYDGPDFGAGRGPYGYMGHFHEIEELVKCIRHGGNGTMSVRDAAYVLAVEKAILQSVETGQIVDFEAYLADYDATFLLGDRRAH